MFSKNCFFLTRHHVFRALSCVLASGVFFWVPALVVAWSVGLGAQLAIGRAGGVQAVLAAMRAHPDSEGVQDRATQALVQLVEQPENVVRLGFGD